VDIENVARLIEEYHVRTVKIGGADLDGVYRGKRVSARHDEVAAPFDDEGHPEFAFEDGQVALDGTGAVSRFLGQFPRSHAAWMPPEEAFDLTAETVP